MDTHSWRRSQHKSLQHLPSMNTTKDLINDGYNNPFSGSGEQFTHHNRVETVNDFHRSSPPVRQCEGITGEISPKTSNQQHQILRFWVCDLPPQDNNKQSKIPEWFPQIIPTIPAAQRIYVLLTLRGFFNNTKKQTASKRDNPARTGSRIRCSKSRILISYWRILCWYSPQFSTSITLFLSIQSSQLRLITLTQNKQV